MARDRVETVRATDSAEAAVCKLAERRIGAMVVEDQWMRHTGVFSERDFAEAVAEHGPRAMAFSVERLMTTPVAT
jgi:CBS domain-containing protein